MLMPPPRAGAAATAAVATAANATAACAYSTSTAAASAPTAAMERRRVGHSFAWQVSVRVRAPVRVCAEVRVRGRAFLLSLLRVVAGGAGRASRETESRAPRDAGPTASVRGYTYTLNHNTLSS